MDKQMHELYIYVYLFTPFTYIVYYTISKRFTQ